MTVRSVLNSFNRCFLICGIGSIHFNQRIFKTTVMFYVFRYFIICISVVGIYDANKWVINTLLQFDNFGSIINKIKYQY
jgi:hypothetical protein